MLGKAQGKPVQAGELRIFTACSVRHPYVTRTMVPKILPLFAALALSAAPPLAQIALAQTPLADVAGRRIMPFLDIKRMVDRAIGGRMIGGDYDPESFTYQLRYMRGTEVVDVVVDARSGRILGRRESM